MRLRGEEKHKAMLLRPGELHATTCEVHECTLTGGGSESCCQQSGHILSTAVVHQRGICFSTWFTLERGKFSAELTLPL